MKRPLDLKWRGPALYAVVESPFPGWAFYVLRRDGQIMGMSNSLHWCEQLVRTLV